MKFRRYFKITAADESQRQWWQKIRDLRAYQWRKGRRILYSLPKEQRQRLIAYWNESPLPKDAAYFADFMWHKTK